MDQFIKKTIKILQNYQRSQFLSEYNPNLSTVTPTTRVAYAKFMRKKIKSEFTEKEEEREKEGEKEKEDIKVESECSVEDEVFETPRRHDSKKSGGKCQTKSIFCARKKIKQMVDMIDSQLLSPD